MIAKPGFRVAVTFVLTMIVLIFIGTLAYNLGQYWDVSLGWQQIDGDSRLGILWKSAVGAVLLTCLSSTKTTGRI